MVTSQWSRRENSNRLQRISCIIFLYKTVLTDIITITAIIPKSWNDIKETRRWGEQPPFTHPKTVILILLTTIHWNRKRQRGWIHLYYDTIACVGVIFCHPQQLTRTVFDTNTRHLSLKPLLSRFLFNSRVFSTRKRTKVILKKVLSLSIYCIFV